MYRTLVRLIENGQTVGLSAKLDLLYALGRLSDEEYQSLVGLLG